jgi:hypothetical protein
MSSIKRSKKYKFTLDGLFAIKNNNSKYLYIKKDKLTTLVPSTLLTFLHDNYIVLDEKEPIKQITQTINNLYDITNDYYQYIFHRPLKDEREYVKDNLSQRIAPIDDNININENDCLKFGECLTVLNQTRDLNRFNEMIQSPEGPSVLQEKSLKNKQFGLSDKKNIAIVNQMSEDETNNNAIPKQGESYAIVMKKLKTEYAPYHIAYVIYTHQNVNITLEASADTGNLYYPEFSFYDINPNGNTFHKVYSKHYIDAITIVLQSRNIEDVLREVDQENTKKQIKMTGRKKSKKRKYKKRKTVKQKVNNELYHYHIL